MSPETFDNELILTPADSPHWNENKSEAALNEAFVQLDRPDVVIEIPLMLLARLLNLFIMRVTCRHLGEAPGGRPASSCDENDPAGHMSRFRRGDRHQRQQEVLTKGPVRYYLVNLASRKAEFQLLLQQRNHVIARINGENP